MSDQITGIHSPSMGKSNQSATSDQRYQRQKLSDQSDQKKLKTVELYANYYDAFQRQNTDNQSECRRSPLAWVPANTGTLVPTVLFWFLLYIKMSTEKLIAAVATRSCTIQAFFISETIQYRNNQLKYHFYKHTREAGRLLTAWTKRFWTRKET